MSVILVYVAEVTAEEPADPIVIPLSGTMSYDPADRAVSVYAPVEKSEFKTIDWGVNFVI